MRFCPVSRWLAVLAVLAPGPALGAEDRWDRWLEEEVRWIISAAERETFRSLDSEERRRSFLERFWKRRDPVPATPRNEYKEEYFRRWEYVKREFREGTPGWRTDRGRVYLIHGAPDQIEARLPAGGNAYGLDHRAPTLIWRYASLAGWSGAVVVVFRADAGTPPPVSTPPALSQPHERGRPLITRSASKTVPPGGAALRYRLVGAGPAATQPELSSGGETAAAINELLRSPGERLERAEVERLRREQSRREMTQQITTALSFSSLPVHMAVHDFYAGGKPTVTVTWQWPYGSLKYVQEEGLLRARVDLMVQVRDGESRVIDEFFKTLDLRYPPRRLEQLRETDYHYWNEFHLPAGEYTVTSLVKDLHSGNLGSSIREVRCVPPSDERVGLSALVLARSVVPAAGEDRGRDLRFQNWRVVPAADPVFSPGEPMVLYLTIYNAQPVKGSPSLVLSYQLLREGRIFRSSPPRKLTSYTGGGTVTYSSVLELDDFAPGPYQIRVNVVDFNTRKFASRTARFVVSSD